MFDDHDEWGLRLHRGTESTQRVLDRESFKECRVHKPNICSAPGIGVHLRECLQIGRDGVATCQRLVLV